MAPVLALVGFMGSGKTEVGRRVADRLGWRFVDLDDLVEARAGRRVADIFATEGEPVFRALEAEALRTFLRADHPPGVVIALGGGTPVAPAAQAVLATGRVQGVRAVYLDVQTDEAWQRVRGSDRPLARSRSTFAALHADRRPAYAAAADARVDAGGDPGQVADEVMRHADSWFAAGVSELARGEWVLNLERTARPSRLEGGPGTLARPAAWVREVRESGRRVFVAADRRVLDLWGAPFFRGVEGTALPVWELEPGEPTKDVAHAAEGWAWLADLGARRDDVLLAFGGGVVGDLAGFVAATYLRGISLWQVPTTLLAQVDSSVGGKVAVNLPAGKNLVGAFFQAERVLIDTEVLRTLSPSEYASGLGEVVKYGLLDGEGFLGTLESEAPALMVREPAVLSEVVRRCVEFKAAVVEEDERDEGRRAILNLGHTAGHALETAMGYGVLPHGLAVGLGLLVALAVSESVLGTDRALRPRVRRLLEALGLPVSADLPSAERLAAAAGHDKKLTAAGRGLVGLRAPGEPVWGLDVPEEEFLRGFEAVRP